jgi:putative hydrolase of the HAD superfamily
LPKIKVLIFDLGGVLVQHNPSALDPAFVVKHRAPLIKISCFYKGPSLFEYECGLISSEDFWRRAVNEVGYTGDYTAFQEDFCAAFDFELKREVYQFIQKLKLKYVSEIELWLLSNISDLHYNYIHRRWPDIFSLFSKVYLSFLLGCRKPDAKIYHQIIQENSRKAKQCAFVDDTAINGAVPRLMGMAFHKFKNLQNLKIFLAGLGITVD